ncbi:Uu.00g021000.m01.CDS01 [Anthostomella pinea]|uniref:Uu.00g021000.m01.CDS01 n=1 Tax=Anthostomella pinea TaxID=933095 RepID=A0AAI8VZL5_9PEZI|nr:Uu.00g021000.m01.CDS01 [Anthostomella pinea]
MSTQSLSAYPLAERRNETRVRADFPHDAYSTIGAFEDRVGDIGRQLSVMQKLVIETLSDQKRLEKDIVSSNETENNTIFRDHLTESRADIRNVLNRHQQEVVDLAKKHRAAQESEAAKLQDALRLAQNAIETIVETHAQEKREQRDAYREMIVSKETPDKTSALEELCEMLKAKTTALETMVEKEAENAQKNIYQYQTKESELLKKFEQEMGSKTMDYFKELRDALHDNLTGWDSHMQQKSSLSEELDREREKVQKAHTKNLGLSETHGGKMQAFATKVADEHKREIEEYKEKNNKLQEEIDDMAKKHREKLDIRDTEHRKKLVKRETEHQGKLE